MTNPEAAMDAIIKAYENTSMTYFGIRGDNFPLVIGEKLEASYDWDYDNDCQSDQKLSGTCATGIALIWFDGDAEDFEALKEAFEQHNEVYGSVYKTVTIIGGTGQEYGADPGEVIIERAEVVYVF